MHLSTCAGAKRLCSTSTSVAQKEGQNFSELALLAWVSHGRMVPSCVSLGSDRTLAHCVSGPSLQSNPFPRGEFARGHASYLSGMCFREYAGVLQAQFSHSSRYTIAPTHGSSPEVVPFFF